jgi:hypothetical protein
VLSANMLGTIVFAAAVPLALRARASARTIR